MIEIIEISNSKEQSISVSYGDRTIIFDLKWNSTLGFWYFNMREEDNTIISGVTMTLNRNLLFDKFNLGKLYLLDTEPENTEPIKMSDLGSRLAFARVY